MWYIAIGVLFAVLCGLLYAKRTHDDAVAKEEDTTPLLMPDGEKNPLTDHLMFDSDQSGVDSRGSATQGVSMRVTSKDY